jgi:hypothetical protein
MKMGQTTKMLYIMSNKHFIYPGRLSFHSAVRYEIIDLEALSFVRCILICFISDISLEVKTNNNIRNSFI